MTFEYRPDYLIDMLIENASLKNDAELASKLGVKPSMISKIRNKRKSISASLLLRMHDAFGHSIQTLREWGRLDEWRKV